MLRKLMSSLLHADLKPNIAWSEIESMKSVAQISVEVPRLWGRTETLEQVLCTSGDRYVLFKRWFDSGGLSRVAFGRSLNGREMRLTETQPSPSPVYRLQLWPMESATVTHVATRPTWFRLWRNEAEMNPGAGVCFVDSTDRDLLTDLRHTLLDGKIPESLQTEEEMWQRINNMAEPERRAAIAALTMQSLGEIDRQFCAMHPDLGTVPEGLRPVAEMLQDRTRGIERTAAAKPVDPALADLMKRFVADATNRASATQDGAELSDEPDGNLPGKA